MYFYLGRIHHTCPIDIHETYVTSGTFILSEEEAMKMASVTLKERLKQDISFNTVVADKGEGAISFRGLNFKATEYVEDDISLGVSPIGGVVQITSTAPTKVFEGTLSTILSSNDE